VEADPGTLKVQSFMLMFFVAQGTLKPSLTVGLCIQAASVPALLLREGLCNQNVQGGHHFQIPSRHYFSLPPCMWYRWHSEAAI
jgi:hypothetical protein